MSMLVSQGPVLLVMDLPRSAGHFNRSCLDGVSIRSPSPNTRIQQLAALRLLPVSRGEKLAHIAKRIGEAQASSRACESLEGPEMECDCFTGGSPFKISEVKACDEESDLMSQRTPGFKSLPRRLAVEACYIKARSGAPDARGPDALHGPFELLGKRHLTAATARRSSTFPSARDAPNSLQRK